MTNDVEKFIGKHVGLRFEGNMGVGVDRDRDNVKGNMQSKLDDSILDAEPRRQKRAKLRERLEALFGKKSGFKRFIHRFRAYTDMAQAYNGLKTENVIIRL